MTGEMDMRDGKGGQSPEKGPNLTVPPEQELQHTLHVPAVKDQGDTSITDGGHKGGDLATPVPPPTSLT